MTIKTINAPSVYKTAAGEKAVMEMYDSLLARWPVPHEEMNISTRHGNTFVIASGNPSEDPLVLLHGAGSNSLTWSSDVSVYSERYRVYAVDLLGEAGRSSNNRPAWESQAYVEWLQDIFDFLGIKKASIIGLSQGAWTALKFAINQPERVDKLVLLTPGGIVPDQPSFVVKAIFYSWLGKWGIQRINNMLLAGQTVPTYVETALTLIMTHFNTRLGILPIFTDQELALIKSPVMVLIGRKDVLRHPEKLTDRMIHNIQNLQPIIIEDGGHALINTTGYVMPFLK